MKLIDFWEGEYGHAECRPQVQGEVQAEELHPKQELTFETYRKLQNVPYLGVPGYLLAGGYTEKVAG